MRYTYFIFLGLIATVLLGAGCSTADGLVGGATENSGLKKRNISGTNYAEIQSDVSGIVCAAGSACSLGTASNPIGSFVASTGTIGTLTVSTTEYVTNALGVGTTTPDAKVAVVGAGSTSSTWAMKLYNAATTFLFGVRNDGYVQFQNGQVDYSPTSQALRGNFEIGTFNTADPGDSTFADFTTTASTTAGTFSGYTFSGWGQGILSFGGDANGSTGYSMLRLMQFRDTPYSNSKGLQHSATSTQTTSAATTTLFTVAVSATSTRSGQFKLVGTQTNGQGHFSEVVEWCAYRNSVTTTATLCGSPVKTTFSSGNGSGWSSSIEVSSGNVLLRVIGATSQTVNWNGYNLNNTEVIHQ